MYYLNERKNLRVLKNTFLGTPNNLYIGVNKNIHVIGFFKFQ